MMKRNNKKISLSIKTVLFITGLLVIWSAQVFASGNSQPNDANAPIKLRIAWFGTKARNDATLATLEAFTKLYPNITFEPEISSSNPEYADKMGTQAAARNLSDIIVQDMGWIADYAARGQLLELKDVDTSEIAKALLDDGSYNGKLYALPNAVASTALVYDKQRVEELGLSNLVKNGWTWNEFWAFCEAAKARVGPNTYVTQDFSYSHTLYMSYQLSQGHGAPITLDGKINFNQQDWMDFQNKFIDFRKRGICPPPDVSVTNRDGDVTLDPLLTGIVLIKTAFSSTFGSWDGVSPGRYALVTYPRGIQSSDYVKVASFWSGAWNTKYPAQAQTVINWLINDVEAGKIMGFARGGAVNNKVLAAMQPQLSDRDKASAALVDFINAHNPQPFMMHAQGWDRYYLNDYEAICQELIFDTVTPQQCYEKVIAKAQEYVK
jgi:ABC-type glycerol-3-phosphate transport system substrate-binding protein